MNSSCFIAAAALVALASTGAAAQGFAPVQPLNLGKSPSVAAAEASTMARSGNVYGNGTPETTGAARTGALGRAAVRAEAVAAAHAPNQNLDRKAFFNSTVPPQYDGRTAGR